MEVLQICSRGENRGYKMGDLVRRSEQTKNEAVQQTVAFAPAALPHAWPLRII
jgi:hypothetical protein